jgi:hypothetical protein
MIQLKKKLFRYIPLQEKAKLLNYIAEKKSFQDWKLQYRAIQMQELRDFLMMQLKNVHMHKGNASFDEEEIRKKMVPIQTYFQSMDCREPIDACFSETCLGSNPACFSNKMKGQIEVILEELYKIMD